ncbi:hypothetical protein GCM10011608_27830 [Micromonospora sonchi]|uniref:Uncharacterized protein n=1 Tax=Micromonospora sonchi TaxID=1763543 RepID=A0A917WX87_9ACTN|nr:hypothetical protein GCM10011608_27830 [Micromonospora sonchi]
MWLAGSVDTSVPGVGTGTTAAVAVAADTASTAATVTTAISPARNRAGRHGKEILGTLRLQSGLRFT